jgi:predicted negative regulator of RcsB-dependent stress response
VDEYLSEKEQIEQIRQWWRDYGWYLIGGIAVSALGYYGLNQYREARHLEAEHAQSLYAELVSAVDDDRPEVDELIARLRDEYPSSPYTDQGGLLIASHYLIQDPAKSVAALRAVIDNTDDPDLAWIARLRLARVLEYREEYDEALAVLGAEDPGAFAAQVSDVKGDIYVSRGDSDAARAAYLEALTGRGAESLDRNYVQMKLNELPSSAAARTPAAGAAAAEGPVSQTPAAEPPVPVSETPATETPATETPATETPAAGAPASGAPAREDEG